MLSVMGKEILHIYCRVSSDSQEDNTSLNQQREKGKKLAGILGYDYKIWDEGAASSSKDDLTNRPVLTDLLGDMREGKVNHLYAEYNDRLSRNTSTWGTIRLYIKEHSVLYYSQNDPNPVDLSDPMDDLIFGILSEVSQFDNRIREQRLSQGKFQRVAEGKWQGGPPPFGYKLEEKELVVDEQESLWVKRIYEEYINGKTLRDIQDILRSNGVLTRRGNTEFSIGAIDKILTNTHYTGTYHITRHKTGETWANTCPTIISQQLRNDVKVLRDSRSVKRTKPTNIKYFYLLTGFLECGECGRKFRGRQTPSQKQFIYYDPVKEEKWRRSEIEDCGGVRSLKIQETDELVRKVVVDVIEQSNIFKERVKTAELVEESVQLSNYQLSRVKRKIRDLEKKINKYTESIGNLKADVIVGENKREVISTIEKLELDREKLQVERDETINLANETEKGKRWKDWVSTFKNRISDVKNMEVGEELREFLTQIIDKILVVKDGDKVVLDVYFQLPFVEDGLVYRDLNNKSKGYDIIDGKSNYLIEYPVKKSV